MITDKKDGEAKTHSAADNAPAGVYQSIQQMGVSEKVKLASLGNKEIRKILIKDSSKIVQVAVVKNPKITEEEIERIASSRVVDKEVLRIIQTSREWMKNYQVKLASVKNPKTPLQGAMRMISHLRIKDIKDLMGSKNVPNPLRVVAKRLYAQKNS